MVGGGPAGLMAAEVLARAGVAVTVYDRMPSPARKLPPGGARRPEHHALRGPRPVPRPVRQVGRPARADGGRVQPDGPAGVVRGPGRADVRGVERAGVPELVPGHPVGPRLVGTTGRPRRDDRAAAALDGLDRRRPAVRRHRRGAPRGRRRRDGLRARRSIVAAARRGRRVGGRVRGPRGRDDAAAAGERRRASRLDGDVRGPLRGDAAQARGVVGARAAVPRGRHGHPDGHRGRARLRDRRGDPRRPRRGRTVRAGGRPAPRPHGGPARREAATPPTEGLRLELAAPLDRARPGRGGPAAGVEGRVPARRPIRRRGPGEGRAGGADRHHAHRARDLDRRGDRLVGGRRVPDAAPDARHVRRGRDARLGGAHGRLPAAGVVQHRGGRGAGRAGLAQDANR